MKEIQPYKVTLFIASVLAILLVIVIASPEDGPHLKLLSTERLLHPKKQVKKDITDIILDVDTTMTEEPIVFDSLVKHNGKSSGDLGAPTGGEISVKGATELLMSEEGKTNIHKLFSTLDNIAAKKQKISMLHYGDSQIEGDRMTSFIRNKLQTQFGGYGPGLIPAINVYNTFTFKQSYSENFERYTAFGGKKLNQGYYGAMVSVGRFTPDYSGDTTVLLDTLTVKSGWIEFSPSKSAYARARTFNTVKMFYNQCLVPVKLTVYQEGKLIHEEDLIPDSLSHSITLQFEETPNSLRYEFSGKISPNISGFSLEGDYGVQVSNIAMRGSSGTQFSGLKSEPLQKMYKELDNHLIIMQFGGNSIPFFKDSAGVESYARRFKRQIKTMQRLNPNAMVVVIGPSDMSTLVETIYETYPLLPYCVERMMLESMDAGAAYWNLYAAMGGQNSMPSWVDKGLAGKDYIHFSNGGAKVASKLFYDAFISEYVKWKKEP